MLCKTIWLIEKSTDFGIRPSEFKFWRKYLLAHYPTMDSFWCQFPSLKYGENKTYFMELLG